MRLTVYYKGKKCHFSHEKEALGKLKTELDV